MKLAIDRLTGCVVRMEPTDLKPNRSARLPGGRMSLDDSA
jgi:hypothetical protein